MFDFWCRIWAPCVHNPGNVVRAWLVISFTWTFAKPSPGVEPLALSDDCLIAKHIVDGEFGMALSMIYNAGPGDADRWLMKVAGAQSQSGAIRGAKSTLRHLGGTGTLPYAISPPPDVSSGGASLADFDSLIDIITSTVAPDSWDDVGGPGSVAPFEGGVRVDTEGLLRLTGPTALTLPIAAKTVLLRSNRGVSRRADDPRRSCELRMVSLTRLQREIQILAALGQVPDDSMEHLAGLREVRYVFLVADSSEVVIAGPAGAWHDFGGQPIDDFGRPVLQLDQLVTLIRNATQNHGRFGCSITPRPESLSATKKFLAENTEGLRPERTRTWIRSIREHMGFQDIEVHGLPEESGVALRMVEADYHMKLVGMGLEPSVEGVTDYLHSIESSTIPASMDVMRWWFTLAPKPLSRDHEGKVFEIAQYPVALMAEDEHIDDDGTRRGTGSASNLNRTFARSFTQHYDQLANKYPVYRRLANVFQLALVAAIVNSPNTNDVDGPQFDWLIKNYVHTTESAATKVESIINHRVIDRRRVVVGVSGGVAVHTANALVACLSEGTEISGEIPTLQPATMPAKNGGAWWWE